MSAVVVPKTRSRVITGWRHAAQPTRLPKWKKPVPIEPVNKTG